MTTRLAAALVLTLKAERSVSFSWVNMPIIRLWPWYFYKSFISEFKSENFTRLLYTFFLIYKKKQFLAQPPRSAPFKYKDIFVCEGTQCLEELAKNHRLAEKFREQEIPDLPYLPSCTGTGLYHAVQRIAF